MTDQPRWPEGTPVAPSGKGPGGGRFRDTGRAGGGDWASRVGYQALGRWQPISRGELSLIVRNGGTDYNTTTLTGGQIATTQIRTYRQSGQNVVHKAHGAFDGPDSVRGEYLTALVGNAIGAPVPAVIRDPDNPNTAVFMQYVPSDLTAAKPPARLTPDVMASDDALLLGLLDVLVYNWDRNSGNWKISTGGRMVGFDHGMAFRQTNNYDYDPDAPTGRVAEPPKLGGNRGARPSQRFIEQIALGIYGQRWRDNDLHPDDIPVIRQRLQALLPVFKDMNMQFYHQEMMERLEALAPHARGTVRVIA